MVGQDEGVLRAAVADQEEAQQRRPREVERPRPLSGEQGPPPGGPAVLVQVAEVLLGPGRVGTPHDELDRVTVGPAAEAGPQRLVPCHDDGAGPPEERRVQRAGQVQGELRGVDVRGPVGDAGVEVEPRLQWGERVDLLQCG